MDIPDIFAQGDKDKLHQLFTNTHAKIIFVHPDFLKLEIGNMAYHFCADTKENGVTQLVYDGWEWTSPVLPIPQGF